MSKTPRTDAQLKLEAFFDGIGIVETVEVEFARELEEELIEAQAEIERLKSEHEDSLFRAKDNAVSLSGTVTEYAGELLAKDKLIEQMVGALNHCKSTFADYVEIHKAKMPGVTIGPIPPNWGDMQRKIARNQEAFDLCNAALSAAERGE